ncbi:MAG: hypothetical protein PVI81_02455 [Anaerolineales bacterium]|jgi:hypothetical protein
MKEASNQNIEAQLRAGIEAARAGEIAKARAILSKVVLEKPRSIHAWWYLGQVVEDTNQRIYCFKKVLNLDPSHAGARAKLGLQPWDKRRNAPAEPGSSSSSSQRRVLIILAILTLLVLIGGGGYIYLDTTGMLNQLLTPATAVPTATTAPLDATPTSAAVSLSTIPTWTSTTSPTPRPTRPTATPTPQFTPTYEPPTPETLPDSGAAQVYDLVSGTGLIVIDPGSFFVMRFEADEPFDLEMIGALLFHANPTDSQVSPTLEVYILDILEGGWQAFGVNWGDNPIMNPGQFVNQDGTIIAALRNWGDAPMLLNNVGFTFAGVDTDGAEVYYGLTRQEIRQPTEISASASPTQRELD